MSFLKDLVDLVISLRNERQRSHELLFTRHIQPTYDAAKLVYSDYMDYFQLLKVKIEQCQPLDEIISYVEQRRMKYISQRQELRAIRGTTTPEDDEETSFDESILTLVSGSHQVNHQFEHFRHRLFFLKNAIESAKSVSVDELQVLKPETNALIGLIDWQVDYLNSKFMDVTKAYNRERDIYSGRKIT